MDLSIQLLSGGISKGYVNGVKGFSAEMFDTNKTYCHQTNLPGLVTLCSHCSDDYIRSHDFFFVAQRGFCCLMVVSLAHARHRDKQVDMAICHSFFFSFLACLAQMSN